MTPFVQPVFAVLDPVYTYTLPPRQVVLASWMRSFIPLSSM